MDQRAGIEHRTFSGSDVPQAYGPSFALSTAPQGTRPQRSGGAYAILRPATRLSTQDIETICSAARQADANAADRR